MELYKWTVHMIREELITCILKQVVSEFGSDFNLV